MDLLQTQQGPIGSATSNEDNDSVIVDPTVGPGQKLTSITILDPLIRDLLGTLVGPIGDPTET